jgi:hypothetical protein
MAQGILAKYFHSFDLDLVLDGKFHLLKNIIHFKPERGSTAFSFCQTVLKNYFSTECRKTKFKSVDLSFVYDTADTSDNDYFNRVSELKVEALLKLERDYNSTTIGLDRKVLKAVHHLISTNNYSNKYFNAFYLMKVCGHTVMHQIERVLKKFKSSGFSFFKHRLVDYQRIIEKYLYERELHETDITIKEALDNYFNARENKTNAYKKNRTKRKFIIISEDECQRLQRDLA